MNGPTHSSMDTKTRMALKGTENSSDSGGGLLTQTLASSTWIKWILPARLRSPLHKDVVLVGQSWIQLRECKDDGLLADVTTKLELGERILAARIISSKEHTVSMQDAILESGREETRFTIRGKPCDESQPPQILVLSLASSELMYVYASENAFGSVHFVNGKRRVISGMSLSEKYGQHLAVDPESRALAVASWKNSFCVMSLKDVDEIKEEIDRWDRRSPGSTKPVKEQRSVEVDGMILKMDFLRSTTLEPEKVILLVIVANAGQTRLLLYRWDTRKRLKAMTPMRCCGQVLQHEDEFPLLLIPLCTITSFAIVTQTKLVCYGDVTGEQVSHTDLDMPCLPEDRGKVWVQWARAVRHEKYKEVNEDIFLIREDGILCTFLVNNASPSASICSTNYKAGDLGMRVDTAMCMLPKSPTMSGDILIAAGDMTEGGVFHLAPVSLPRRLQSFPNWSPVHDMTVLDHRTPQHASQVKSSTFITSGRLKDQGALMQLSYGLEALIGWTIEYPEASSIDRLWTLGNATDPQVLLLISHHEHSTALLFDPEGEELVLLDEESCSGLSFNSPTLAAAGIADDFILQITNHGINSMSMHPGKSQQISTRPSSHILCAEIDSASGLFVTASRKLEMTELSIGIAAATDENTMGISISPYHQTLDFVPVALCLCSINDVGFCFVASQDATIHVYSIDPVQGLKQTQSCQLSHLISHQGDDLLSSISILAPSETTHALLLCGFKSGRILYAKISAGLHTVNSSILDIRGEKWEIMGDTAVSIKSEECNRASLSRSAVMLCGSNIRRITASRNQNELEYGVDALWITSKDSDSYAPPNINAFDRIHSLSSQRGDRLHGLFAFAGGEDILMCVCSPKKVISRHIENLSRPRIMTYSNYVKKLVISVTSNSDTQNTTSSYSTGPTPMLQLVDGIPKSHDSTGPVVICGHKGERIRSLLEWRPTDGSIHFEMIVVGMENGIDGWLSYISGARLQQHVPRSKMKKLFDFHKKPVHAMCAFGYSSLAVCAGRELKILYLDLSNKKLEARSTFELPSPAVSIASRGSIIFVATSLHSFIVLREEDKSLKVVNTAKWAGTAKHIVPFAETSVMVNIVSDRGSKIVGFANRLEHEVEPVFEADVPFAIDRLRLIKQSENEIGGDRFQAATVDGTFYLFTTLNRHETQLLKFLEQVMLPYHSTKLTKLSLKMGKRSMLSKLQVSNAFSSDGGTSHIRGDVLQRMLEPGRFNIHNLFRPSIKLEDEMEVDGKNGDDEIDNLERLRYLARPVLQPNKPTIEAVSVWLRNLLNSAVL